jgi:hypothetical protein
MMDINRVITPTAIVEREPWVNPSAQEVGCVVVAEIIVMIIRRYEQVIGEHAKIDGNGWCVTKRGSAVNDRIKVNRRKKYAAPIDRVIPETIYEYVTARSVGVMSWIPSPIRLSHNPRAGTPNVVVLPNPGTWYPNVVSRWSVAHGTVLETLRRSRQVRGFVHIE